MTYSCTDFADSILDALGIELDEEDYDNPSAQADLALAVIERLKKIESDLNGFVASVSNLAARLKQGDAEVTTAESADA
jgi:spermidine/putrescine-binding protein